MSNVIDMTEWRRTRQFQPTFCIFEQGGDVVKFQAFAVTHAIWTLLTEAVVQCSASARARAMVVVPFAGCIAPESVDTFVGTVQVHDFGKGTNVLVAILTHSSAAAMASRAKALGLKEVYPLSNEQVA